MFPSCFTGIGTYLLAERRDFHGRLIFHQPNETLVRSRDWKARLRFRRNQGTHNGMHLLRAERLEAASRLIHQITVIAYNRGVGSLAALIIKRTICMYYSSKQCEYTEYRISGKFQQIDAKYYQDLEWKRNGIQFSLNNFKKLIYPKNATTTHSYRIKYIHVATELISRTIFLFHSLEPKSCT